MIIALLLVVLFIITVALFTRQPKFGRSPQGPALSRLESSPYFKNGSFQNLSNTPSLTEGASYYSVLKEFIFGKRPRRIPVDDIPSVKTDLLHLDDDKNILVWFGHSSYFMQVDGKKILVDPVLSGIASPLSFTTRAFKGSNPYSVQDIPGIDFLFLSHDHWDHLDHPTIVQLKPRVKQVICGLGVAEHLLRWGYDKSIIHELDWNETLILENGFIVNTVPARHFSGRGFRRNQSLWLSFAWKTPTMNIFIGGDSGYDTHFAEAGRQFGPFDIAILENGQYDRNWRYIHMMPAEVLQAGKDLRAKRLLPVHSSKFALGNHAWDDPLKTITSLHHDNSIRLITPMIGEVVDLKNSEQVFSKWWERIR